VIKQQQKSTIIDFGGQWSIGERIQISICASRVARLGELLWAV
jgi:hypothetical protein